MRINSSLKSGSGQETENIFQSELGLAKAKETTEFKKLLNAADLKNHHQNLESLLKEVNQRAAKLVRSCTIRDLKEYKRSVRKFLEETMGKAYQAQDGMGWDSTGKHKLYVLIKKVDAKLEELSMELIRDQKDNLELLQRLDEIRGLLVDIYM